MAALEINQIDEIFTEGEAAKLTLFSLSNVSAGDTADFGPEGYGWYLALKQAALVGATAEVSAACDVSGTTVTIPDGLSQDAIYLLVWGDAVV